MEKPNIQKEKNKKIKNFNFNNNWLKYCQISCTTTESETKNIEITILCSRKLSNLLESKNSEEITNKLLRKKQIQIIEYLHKDKID
jgi:hypothetical protein